MKRTMRFSVGGQTVDVPEDELNDFNAAAQEHGATPDEIRKYRVGDKDVDVPQSQYDQFAAIAKERGAQVTPLRTMTMADGTRRDFTMSEMSKFLRSKEYRESEDYTPPQMGSVAGAAVKGALAGAAEGAWQGGNAAANAIAKALPEVGIGVESALGHAINLGGNAKNAVGDWLVKNAAENKAWLDAKLPSEAKEWTGYEDWSTKIADKFGEMAAMTYKFAPGMSTMGAKAFMETVFASDGVNAAAQAFDRAKSPFKADGVTPKEVQSDTAANLEAAAAFLVNYFGGKLLMKGGAAAEGIKNPALRWLASGAATSAVMAEQSGLNKAIENLGESKPISEGVLPAMGEGAVEGAIFHGMNALPGAIAGAYGKVKQSREQKAMLRESTMTALESGADGRNLLATLYDNEGVDAAIRARKEGKDVSRKMGAAADLPDNMSAAERNAVIDGISKAREAQAERVRTKMDDVQAQSLADEIGQNLKGGASDPMFEDIWLNATRRIKDATELDEPGARARIVGEAIEDVVGKQLDAGPAKREAKSYEEKFAENRRLRTPTRVGEKEIAEDQEARAMGRRIEAEGEAQRKAAAEKAQADYDEKMAAYEEARAKRAAEKKRGIAKDKLTPLPEKPTPPELRVEERKKPVIEANLSDLSKKTAKVDKETGENAEIVSTKAENAAENLSPREKEDYDSRYAKEKADFDAKKPERERKLADVNARIAENDKEIESLKESFNGSTDELLKSDRWNELTTKFGELLNEKSKIEGDLKEPETPHDRNVRENKADIAYVKDHISYLKQLKKNALKKGESAAVYDKDIAKYESFLKTLKGDADARVTIKAIPIEPKPTKVPDGRGMMVEKKAEGPAEYSKDAFEPFNGKIPKNGKEFFEMAEAELAKAKDRSKYDSLASRKVKELEDFIKEQKSADGALEMTEEDAHNMTKDFLDDLNKQSPIEGFKPIEYFKKPQPSQPLENAPSRAPTEAKPMSQAEGAKPVEAQGVENGGEYIDWEGATANKTYKIRVKMPDFPEIKVEKPTSREDYLRKWDDVVKQIDEEKRKLTKYPPINRKTGKHFKPNTEEYRKWQAQEYALDEKVRRVYAEAEKRMGGDVDYLFPEAEDVVAPSTRVPDGKGKMKDVDVFRKSQQEADERRFALKHKMDEERKKLTEGLKISDDVYVHKIAERDGYSTVQNNMGIGDRMEPYGIKNASAIERALNETENLAEKSYRSTKDYANDKLNGMKKALSDAGYEIYGEQGARKIRKISDVKVPDGEGRMVKKAENPAPTAKADGDAKTKNSIVDADTARTDENWGFRKATNAIEFQEQMDALENYENHLSLKLPEPPINPKTKRPYGKNTPQYKEWAEKRRAAYEEYKREVDRVKKLIGEESEHWGTASEARAQEIVDKAVRFDKKKLSRRDELEYDNTKIELENAFDQIPLEELRELTDGYGNISRNGIGELSESQTRLLDAIEAVNRFHEQASKYQRLKRDKDGRPIFQISEATPAQKLADPDFKAWARKQGRTPTDGARRIYDAQRVDAVLKVAKNWLKGVKMRRSENAAEVPQGARMSIGNLYTGSAADYEKPSLLKVGTGEGSQVYGWGLYASDQRGVAEEYAKKSASKHYFDKSKRVFFDGNEVEFGFTNQKGSVADLLSEVRYHSSVDGAIKEMESELKKYGPGGKFENERVFNSLSESLSFIKKNKDRISTAPKYGNRLYEQTFFTNRAPGDESHLLKWFEPVSEENWKRIISEARKEFDNGSSNVDPEYLEGIKANFSVNDGGRRVYEALSDKTLFGSPQAASEFLARADIDGIRYPVDSYGGKTVKDGDKAGWNYVSFRDDNITVDHKWVDGKIRYLYSRDGNVVGWYDRAKKEVVTLPGADAATVAHELGWHATYDYAQAEAAQGRTALLDKLNDYAANAPQSVKNEILRKYGMATDAAVLLDEIGAARYTMDNVNKIKDAATRRQTAKWYQRTWNAIADTYKAMLSKMGWNKARLDNLSALTPEETVNLLADEMLKGRNLGKAKSTQIDMSKGESIEQLHDRKLKDRLRPIEEIEKDSGKSVGNSAYTLFRTLPGKVQGAIDKAQNFAEKVKADCKKAGIKIEELNEFLYASAASERNAKVLARNGSLDGSAMSHADIQRILSAYRNSPKYAELRRIADDVLAFQRKGFDFRRKAGLISDETWNTLLADEPNHVPMKNRFDPNGEHMGFSLTEQFGKPEWKTAEGRTNVGDGPLEWIVQEYVDAFSRGHENVARRALLETVLAHPEVGEVKKLGPNDALGEVKRKGQQGDPNVFVVKTDGDTYQVKLNGTRGELIARAVSGRGLVRAPQSLQKAMRWWSSTATSWSPTFAVRNFLSDTVDVFAVNIGEKGLIKGTGAFGKHVKTALKLTNAIRKYASTGETTDPLIREAVDAGVLMGGGVRGQAFADAGEAALKTLKTDWRNGKNRVKAVRNFLFGWIDTLNQTAELMNRMADYKLQMESLSKANNALPQNRRRSLAELRNEAALHAREITVDFNEKGELTPVTNMLYMFSNSTLGATMRLGKAIFASKEGKSLAAGTFALGLIEGTVEALANGDDEDGKDMNEYTRANSFYFRKGKDIYRIPLHASPISVIKYAGNCTARKLFGTLRGDKAAEQIAKDMIGMMTSFLGIGALGDNEAASIAPTIIQPFLQAYMNRDFADRPIERTSFSEEKPKSGNGRPSTPQFYHDLAKWLNEFGGGNAGRKGEFLGVGTDFSPEMLKHFTEATGKNALRDIENTVEFAKMVLGKTEWDRRNVPVGRDYFRTTGGNDNRFFEAVRAYKTDASDFKERTGADRKKFEDSHPWLKEGRDGRTTVNRLINMTNRDKPRDGVEEMGITQLRKLTEGKIRRNDGTYFKPNTPVSDELKEKAKEWLQKRQARIIEIMGK